MMGRTNEDPYTYAAIRSAVKYNVIAQSQEDLARNETFGCGDLFEYIVGACY